MHTVGGNGERVNAQRHMMMMSTEVLQVRDVHHKGIRNCSMIVNIVAQNYEQCHDTSHCEYVDAIGSNGSEEGEVGFVHQGGRLTESV